MDEYTLVITLAVIIFFYWFFKTQLGNAELRAENRELLQQQERKLDDLKRQIGAVERRNAESLEKVEGTLEEIKRTVEDVNKRTKPMLLIQPERAESLCQSPVLDKQALKQASDLLEYMRAPNPLFIGYEQRLEDIYQSYVEHQPAEADANPTLRSSVIHVINGLAGCGKSEIAIQYIRKYFKIYTSGVLWIPAGSPATLDYVFKRTAEKLNLFGEKKDVRPDVTKKAVTDWLTEKSNWLLVLDNADLSGNVFDYFPNFPNGGHIIITSRDTSYATSILYPVVKKKFHIKPLKQDEAMVLLVRYVDDQPNGEPMTVTAAKDMIQKMAEQNPANLEALQWLAGPDGLDGLPLALIAAAKYMNENKTSFSGYKQLSINCIDKELFPTAEDDPLRAFLKSCYLDKYHENIRERTHNSLTAFLELTKSDLTSSPIEMTENDADRFLEERDREVFINKWMYKRKSVLATWSLTFRHLTVTQQGRAALELLQMCVFLEPTVSEQLIIQGVESISLKDLHAALKDKVKGLRADEESDQVQRNLNTVLKELRRHCLVDTNETNIGRAKLGHWVKRNFTIHRVMRKAVKADLSEDTYSEKYITAISGTISFLVSIFPTYEQVYRRFTGPYEAISEEEEEVALHTKTLSRNLRNDLLTAAKGEIHNPADLLYAVALYYRLVKWRRDEALVLYKKALEVETILGAALESQTQHFQIAYAHFQLGRVLMELDNKEKALRHLAQAEDHYRKSCSEEKCDADVTLAKMYNIQAMALEGGYARDYNKPIPDESTVNKIEGKFQTAIKICQKHYKNEPGKWTAIAMHEYAVFLRRKEPVDTGKIETLFRESLEMKKKVWGSEDNGNHISIAIGMTDLAVFYLANEDVSKYEEAEGLLTKALKIKECVLSHYEQFDSWQIGVYFLIRLYMLLGNDEEKKKYENLLKEKSEKAFEEEFASRDLGKAFPPDPMMWA